MRVVILTSPHHFYGNYLVKKILDSQDVCQVVGIVESSVILSGKSLIQSLWSLFQKSGFSFLFLQGFKKITFNIAFYMNRISGIEGPRSIFKYYGNYVQDRKIPHHSTSDVNQKETADFIRSCSPDIIVILLFAQLLKRSIIEIPRLGSLNFHPSFLPKNRGLMPVFAALANGDADTGATLHSVDTAIDSGRIIARKPITINPDDTEHSLYSRICCVGGGLLVDVITAYSTGDQLPMIDASSEEVSYCSIPDRSAVKKFRCAGRKMYRFNELFKPFESF